MRVPRISSPPMAKLWNGPIQVRTSRLPKPRLPPVCLTPGVSGVTPARAAAPMFTPDPLAPVSNRTRMRWPLRVA